MKNNDVPRKTKVWIIQTIIAPYREPLFQKISESRNMDFRLILTSTHFKSRPQWKKELSQYGFTVETVPGWVLNVSHDWETSINPSLLFKAIREKPDVIICAGYEVSSIFVLLYKLMFGGRYIIWTESTLQTEKWIPKFKIFICKFLAKNACCFIDAGKLSRQYVKSLLPRTTGKIFFRAYNCINTHIFTSGGSINGFNTKRILPEKKILFVGRIDQLKGVPQLLEMYRLLIKVHRNTALFMLGEGPLEQMVLEYKNEYSLEHLYLEGWKAPEAVAAYYRAADLIVLLSLKDRNPLVVFEALSTGKPMLS